MIRIRQLINLLILTAVLTACSDTTPAKTEATTLQGTTLQRTVAQGSTGSVATTAVGSAPFKTIPDGAVLPPVESRPPNTSYQPAFAGQTRAPGVKTATAYRTEVVTEGLREPWSVKELPDGRLIVTEKSGALRLVTPAGDVGEAIRGFPELESGSQGGLLDVLPARDFATSRILYFTLAEKTAEGSLTAVARARLSDQETELEQFTILYRAIPYFKGGAHFGSRLVFDSQGNLLVTTGERQSSATRNNAQTLDNGYGKVLRITTDGLPASGNPFLGQAGALPEIYSYGHRNPQGLALHPRTGAVWISEMGPRGGDELNLIEPGKNYGWPRISYGIEYTGAPIGEGLTVRDGMEQPVYYWDPVLAPSGMTFYESAAIPEWQDNLFIAGLAGQHIARIVLEGGAVVGEERLLTEEGQRFRDITQSRDGSLYAVTDGGRLYRIGK